MIINATGLKKYVKTRRPGTRVSKEYIQALERKVAKIVDAHLHINGGKTTMKADILAGKGTNQREDR